MGTFDIILILGALLGIGAIAYTYAKKRLKF